MRVLVILEPDLQALTVSGRALMSASKEIGQEVHVLVMGKEHQALAEAAAKIEGVKQVYCATKVAAHIAESAAECVFSLAGQFDALLAPATTFGKNVLPRVAARLDVVQISEVTRIVSTDIFEHPIYAGNAIETVQVLDKVKVLTVRTTAFEAIKGDQAACPIIQIDNAYDVQNVTFVGLEQHVSERPELSRASIVVSGGRGLQSAEKFKLIEELADALGAAVGASRAAVDAGFVPNDYQVGQTGKIVAPMLYIAVGISGAVQHLAGMKDAKVIVAINKDEDAPIFQVATYGLVGDLFEAVPKLIDMLRR